MHIFCDYFTNNNVSGTLTCKRQEVPTDRDVSSNPGLTTFVYSWLWKNSIAVKCTLGQNNLSQSTMRPLHIM